MQPPSSDQRVGIQDDSPGVSYWEPSGVVTSMWLAIGIALGSLGMFLFGLIYTVAGSAPPDGELYFNWWIVAAFSGLILAAHQLVHAAAARVFGGNPTIDLDVVQWIFPVMYCRVIGQYFSRPAFLTYALAPLVSLSMLGSAAMMIDHRAAMLIIPLALNSGLSTRDVWMAWIAWKLPDGSLIQAQKDGLTLISSDTEAD